MNPKRFRVNMFFIDQLGAYEKARVFVDIRGTQKKVGGQGVFVGVKDGMMS